ncbi:hypothetical protein K440DRAFT_605883 [Wilcoxina mikolae CBS 423.85]|nr:hypothetical protein K440DRAFT_605883 [Wilcoxina mikolae CBS 423.85]
MPIRNLTPFSVPISPVVISAATPHSSTPSETSEEPAGGSSSNVALHCLQTKRPFDLLDEIDQLQSHGISESVSLPQIVICGDQSSGKTSFLQAITGIPFPHTGITYLCPMQFKLRRNSINQARVTIVPDSRRSSADREKLEQLSDRISDFSKLPTVLQDIQTKIVFECEDGEFSGDTLSIEVCGPEKPQLTLIDLPALVQSKYEGQFEFEKTLMADERTIILAVMTTKNDNADQVVLKHVKEADPKGIRTFGILITTESENETASVSLAENKDANFKLGWHVLLDRNYEEGECKFEERNRTEREFFKAGAWSGVGTGIGELESRLNTLYLSHIKKELPRVHQDIINILGDCNQEMELLGQPRSTPEEQRMLLFRASERFGDLCKSAVEGTYEDNFFGFTKERVEQQKKRLRARIQALNSGFATKMRVKGHLLEIVANGEDVVECQSNRPKTITREQAAEWVKPLLLESRGRDLPGTFNSLLISELFWEQSKGWEKIARRHLDKVFRECNDFLKIVLKNLAPARVIDSLFACHIDTMMAERFKSANSELEELLGDRRRHAITYNRAYTETLQKIREKRLRDQYKDAINTVLTKSGFSSGLTTEQLLQALVTPAKSNVDDYACQEVLDCMLAFYQVAFETFVDNVATVVVERRLVNHLWDIFSPLSVAGMPVDTVAAICEEPPEDQERRKQLEEKRLNLRVGLEICEKALQGMNDGLKEILERERSSEDKDLDDDSDEDMTTDNCEKCTGISTKQAAAQSSFALAPADTTGISVPPAVPASHFRSPLFCSPSPVTPAWTFISGFSGFGCSSDREPDSGILSSRGGTGSAFPLAFIHPPPQGPRDTLQSTATTNQPREPATYIFKAHLGKEDNSSTMMNRYQNIGFMPELKDMSMEELRLADYDRGWKFGEDTKKC